MNYVLKIDVTAQSDIDETFEHYTNIQPNLGLRFVNTLQAIFDRIENNPFQFPQYQVPYREAFMIDFPYIIVFEVEESVVVVFAVFHTSRNPSNKFKKRK